MSKRELRWGLLGCGLITGDFAEALKLLPQGEHKVIALGSKSLERCKDFKAKHGLMDAKTYGSYEDFYKDPEIEVVYVGTRNNVHLENVLALTKAKKHVLCEKPLGLNKKEVLQMIESAKANGVFFLEAFWSRYFPVYHEIKKVLKSGDLGEIRLVQANLGFPIIDKLERLNRLDLGGGMTLDLGCYLVQFALHVFGKDAQVEKITACGWKYGEVDDTAYVTIKFSGNRVAQLMYTGTAAIAGFAQISGTNGHIVIPSVMNAPEQCKVTVMQSDVFAEPKVSEIEHPRPKDDLNKYFFKTATGLAYEADAVRKHILNGDHQSEQMSWDETVKIAEILDEIKQQLGMPY